MDDESRATAHRAWDARWRTEEGRAAWLTPEPEVAAFTRDLRRRKGFEHALDLGCGIGRHALHLADIGFKVEAIDGSEAGLAHAGRAAAAAGHAIVFRQGAMTDLPFPAGSFDYVLSWNVIYHGDPDVVAACLAEIRRVLRPGGVYQGTMLSKRHHSFGVGREIAPDTWVDDAAPEAGSDKGHPHFYCDRGSLDRLFRGFDLLAVSEREHAKPASWHWHLIADRRD